MEADIIIEGNVGHDVEWREHEHYGVRAVFDVAVTRRMFKDGEWRDVGPTTWYRVTCWRRLAEHVRDSIKKGDAVIVKGRLDLDRWVSDSGVNKYELTVDARWIGHDLRRGTTRFERSRSRPEREAPLESDDEAAREEAEYEMDAHVIPEIA